MTGAVTPARASRIDSIDLVRGIVMVIMLLDHTRDFVHQGAFRFDPTDLSHTYPLLFATRWITHFCAPIFVFLAGTGAYLQRARGKSIADLSRFLVTRGLFLIVAEFTLVRTGGFFNFDYSFIGVAQVIWAIGWSMIVLAGLIRLPLKAIAIFGIGMILLHNTLDGVTVTTWRGPGSPTPGLWASIWIILHQPAVLLPFGFPGPIVFVLYPLVPWIGVMAAGYAFGRVYDWDAERRNGFLMKAGLAVTAGFFLLRAINLYGDPNPWSAQHSWQMSVVSFFNVTKYPPSLLYLMMTVGPALIALALFEKRSRRENVEGDKFSPRRFFVDFGRVPMFFYLLQWPTAKLLAILLHKLAGKPIGFLFANPGPGPGAPPNAGFRLAMVYAAWITGVLLLYPLCRWYGRYKRTHTHWWLGYI